MAAADEGGNDPSDPDVIAANPPEPETDPRQYFQTGAHQGKWAEYDERGVPTKNIKKRKPAKKEKDALEAEFLDAKKKYQQYLKDVEAWEVRVKDAEDDLERTDKLRWAYRQIGESKLATITSDELDELFRIMGWDHVTKKEMGLLKKVAEGIVDSDSKLTLEVLRSYTAERMPALLLEERLGAESLDNVNPEDIYSPRTWRRKLDEYDVPRGEKNEKKEKKSKKESSGSKSPTGSISPRGKKSRSADDGTGSRSPRDKKDKARSDDGTGSRSPRDKKDKAPKSPRSKKDKKDKKGE